MNQNKLRVSGQFLYSFTVVAKHMSFTKAAEDLCITQSAVSHRMRCLEQELGFPLFHRLTRKIILTEEGRERCTARWTPASSRSTKPSEIFRRRSCRGISSSPAPLPSRVAGCCRCCRDFSVEHPDISLHIRSGNDLISYENEEGNADVAILIAATRLPTGCTRRTPLLRDNLLPVCSQRYAREREPDRRSRSVAQLPADP